MPTFIAGFVLGFFVGAITLAVVAIEVIRWADGVDKAP